VLRLHPELEIDDATFLAIQPGPAPRRLPRGYAMRQILWSNVAAFIGLCFALFGLLFGCLGCPLTIVLIPLGLGFMGFGILFGGLGLAISLPAMRSAQRGLRALQIGEVVQGHIVDVTQDTSQNINGRHPWLLRYVFDTGASVHEGAVHAWEWLEGEREPDEPVWVVFLEEDPEINALWPPVK
jgi:hypothetical protein